MNILLLPYMVDIGGQSSMSNLLGGFAGTIIGLIICIVIELHKKYKKKKELYKRKKAADEDYQRRVNIPHLMPINPNLLTNLLTPTNKRLAKTYKICNNTDTLNKQE